MQNQTLHFMIEISIFYTFNKSELLDSKSFIIDLDDNNRKIKISQIP
jgi:hypothetical protein